MSYKLDDVIDSKYIVAEEIANNKRRYIGLEHRHQVENLMVAKGNSLYEVISYPAAGFMDIDLTTSKEIAKIVEKLTAHGAKVIVSPNNQTENPYDVPQKYHIYTPNLVFRTPGDMKDFMTKITIDLDRSVYRINGLMRLPYNTKFGKFDYYLLPDGVDATDAVISTGTGKYKPTGAVEHAPSPPKEERTRKVRIVEPTGSVLLRYLAHRYDSFNVTEPKPGTFNLKRLEPSGCPLHLRIHDHIDQQIVLARGKLYLKCQGDRMFLRTWT